MDIGLKCARCGRVFKRIQGLRSHQRRKTPCDIVLPLPDDDEKLRKPFQCKYCNRIFTRIDHLIRHEAKNCRIAPRADNPEGTESLCKFLSDKQTESSSEKSVTVYNDNTENIQNITNNQTFVFNTNIININIFGEENTKVLSVLKLRSIVDSVQKAYPLLMIADGDKVPFNHVDVVKASLRVLIESAMIIYSNPDHPENITCYTPNKVADMAMVHAENGWELVSQDLVIPKMASVTLDAILDSQPTIYEDGCGDLIGVSDYEPAMKAVRDLVNDFNRTGSMSGFKKILVKNRDLLN